MSVLLGWFALGMGAALLARLIRGKPMGLALWLLSIVGGALSAFGVLGMVLADFSGIEI